MRALEIKNLEKTFLSNFLIRKYNILKGINLSAETGEIYGFLGPNGAGKTTTIKSVLGLIKPDKGEISILGRRGGSVASRKTLGFLPEHPYFYDYLNAEELIQFSGRLFNIPRKKLEARTKELLQLVGLQNKKNLKLKKFSKGMVQRVGLAQALVHDPEFLILDEPFSGLDPIGRKELRDIILSLKEQGKTIFFSSHILQDMELMVDKVGIILDGKIIKEGKLNQLISHSVRYNEIVFSGIDKNLLAGEGIDFQERDGDFILKSEDSADTNKDIEYIIRNNGKIISVTPVKMTLEDIFLKEIKR
jgi:ABC-2 type transport system ATP-binding protein